MKLELDNEIAFFDIESTGLSITKDRIVEISIVKLLVEGGEETKTWRINPEQKIPKEVTKIHGITDEDVENMPKMEEVAAEIVDFFGQADLAGFNILKFDLPILMEELLRVGVEFNVSKRRFIDVQKIYHMMEKRTLEAAVNFYLNKNLDNAHSAEADTIATKDVFIAQVEKYQKLGTTIDEIHNFIGKPSEKMVDFTGRIVFNENGEEVFNFGKYNGLPVEDILRKFPGYYHWIQKSDFSLYTKQKLKEIKLRISDIKF